MGKQVTISDVTFRAGELPLIAGPCVIESRAHSLEMAEKQLAQRQKSWGAASKFS